MKKKRHILVSYHILFYLNRDNIFFIVFVWKNSPTLVYLKTVVVSYYFPRGAPRFFFGEVINLKNSFTFFSIWVLGYEIA